MAGQTCVHNVPGSCSGDPGPHKFLGETIGTSRTARTDPTPSPTPLIAATATVESSRRAGGMWFQLQDKFQCVAGADRMFARSNRVKTAPHIHLWSKSVTGISSRCQTRSREPDTLRYIGHLARPQVTGCFFPSGYHYNFNLNIILIH